MKHILKSSLILALVFLFIGCTIEETPTLDEEISAIENGLTTAVFVKGEKPKHYSIAERMKHHKVPGISIAIVRKGAIRWAKGYGIANTGNGKKADVNTLFQAGSISKPLAALSALKLVENKKLELDVDINSYLTQWELPENEFTIEEKVTLRRLLTHTAGTTVHGFPGYQQTDTFPSIEQVLNGDGNTSKIYVDTIPGLIWRYSGGGYTVMEKVVEDISGFPLEKYMDQNIFQPLGMENSTYEQPLPSKYHEFASAAYNNKGELIEGLWHNYPEQAAAGLWTTPTDLAMYCIEIQEILAGKQDGILNKETVEMMLTKHKNEWGLGLSLEWDGDSLRFQHGGKNAGFTNGMIAFAHRGDAVIIMTNADNGGKLIDEILRSVSGYYNLGISKPKVVEMVELSSENLNRLIGKYILDEQVPDIGDYFVELLIDNNKLIVVDPNNGERDEMTALDSLNFIDLEDGDKMVFDLDTDSIGFIWNNRFQFHKIIH